MARGSKQEPKAGLGGAVRKLFRQAIKSLTDREDDTPAPKKSGRSRRDGDTTRRFTKTAARLTRLRSRPGYASSSALIWLTDTLDWLDLWHPASGVDPVSDTSHETANNHLSPRL